MNPFIAPLHLLDPETAHGVTLMLLKAGLVPVLPHKDDPALATTLWGKLFHNPIGLAAGFDKNAEVVLPLFKCGFGFVEAGTVTPRAQAGNPQPRLFRWSEAEGILNRLGFNNNGLDAYCMNLRGLRTRALPGIVGGNIGRNKDSTDAIADYVTGLKAVAPYADYVTVNISSPNTPGLRGLQNRDELTALLAALQETRRGMDVQVPLLVKIAPDLDEEACEAIADVAMAAKIDGLIVSNTTLARPANMPADLAAQAGGLSGKPLFVLSTEILKRMARLTRKQLPLIGVGGVASAEDAYVKIRAGASLVQLYSALVYQGPWLVPSIKSGLVKLLKRDGFSHVNQAVGADVKL